MLKLEINEMHLVQHTYLHLYANPIVLIVIKKTIQTDLNFFSRRFLSKESPHAHWEGPALTIHHYQRWTFSPLVNHNNHNEAVTTSTLKHRVTLSS